jgi:flavodoxin I
MSKMGLFYTSSSLTVEDVASNIQERMSGVDIDLQKVKKCVENTLQKYDLLIFGVPSWKDGLLEDDWEDYIANLDEETLLSKTVAIFGLGETEVYCKNFLDAMQTIYKKIVISGSSVIGSWPSEGYLFKTPHPLLLGKGRESELVHKNIEQWIEFSTPYFSK